MSRFSARSSTMRTRARFIPRLYRYHLCPMPRPRRSSARAYLAARTRLGIKFGLDTMRALMDALGHPESAYPVVLVAGTNGKGSVVAYLDAALRVAGLRAGRYTSPHLVRLNERIAVAGREVSDRDLERAVGAVRAAATRLVAERRIPAHPTFFEAVTAAALVHFRDARVEVALVEVGLGGRLDATNVTDPIVSAIVTIARGHEEFLGHGLAAIAREKAGVMREGRATVVGPLPPAARKAVAAEARRVGARLVEARNAPAAPRTLPGAHQLDNARVARAVLAEM